MNDTEHPLPVNFDLNFVTRTEDSLVVGEKAQ